MFVDSAVPCSHAVCPVIGGASFSASFGPGRYRAFTCVDFKGAGYDLVRLFPHSFAMYL